MRANAVLAIGRCHSNTRGEGRISRDKLRPHAQGGGAIALANFWSCLMRTSLTQNNHIWRMWRGVVLRSQPRPRPKGAESQLSTILWCHKYCHLNRQELYSEAVDLRHRKCHEILSRRSIFKGKRNRKYLKPLTQKNHVRQKRVERFSGVSFGSHPQRRSPGAPQFS